MTDNYLAILQEDLNKKNQLLDEVMAYSIKQEELLKQEKLSLEEFDVLVDQKDILVEQLTKLDEGFESVYERVKEQLSGNREQYKSQIKALQELISSITEKSVSIQAKEARNKAMVEQHFAGIRKEMHQNVKSTRAAYNYYKGTTNAGYVPSQFLDQKK